MSRNYSVKETIRRIKEKKSNEPSEQINSDNTQSIENIDTSKLSKPNDQVIEIKEEFDAKKIDHKIDHKKDSMIQSIAKRFKWW